MKWAHAGPCEVTGELLQTRLMANRWIRIRAARGGLGRVLTAQAVHVILMLGHVVVRLEILIRDWPLG